MPRLSRSERLRMGRLAAEEFFLRRGRPPTQYRPLHPEAAEPAPEATPQTDLPKPGSVLGVQDSKAILARLASGDIKQVRRR